MIEEKLDIELMETNPLPEITTTMNTIEENDNDESEMPEINTLLYNNRSVGKRLHDASGNSPGVMMKRPTFPRITSAVNEYTSSTNTLRKASFPRITSAVSINMSSAVRKRKESVISILSQYDFGGSALQIHMDVSFIFILLKIS